MFGWNGYRSGSWSVSGSAGSYRWSGSGSGKMIGTDPTGSGSTTLVQVALGLTYCTGTSHINTQESYLVSTEWISCTQHHSLASSLDVFLETATQPCGCNLPTRSKWLSTSGQCCGSRSGINPDPGGQKWPKKYKKLKNFIFWSAGCSFLRADGFSCSLDVLYGGLGISKLQFLITKDF